MTKKSIKRGRSFDDEWSIGASLGEKIDTEDLMDVQDRTISFKKKKTPSLEDITDDLQDRASNTSQFVKLINAYLKDKKSHIEKIIDLTNNFDQEVQNLKTDNTKITKLNDTPIHEFSSNKMKRYAQDLLHDREQRRTSLNKLKNDIIEAEKALYQVDSRLEKVNEHILEKEIHVKKLQNKQELKDSKLIKELSSLVEKYDQKAVSNALKKLNVSVEN